MKKKKVRVYMPKAQEGMEAPQQAQQQAPPQDAAANQMQQVMQMVEQMVQQGAQPHDIVMALLQQGVPPEAVGQILVQMGMPQEQVAQVIQEVMQSAQGGQGQEQPQGQPQMAEGGMAGDPPTKNDWGSFYKHPERPDYTFMYTKNGWFMLDDKLGDTWQPIHDPDGTWAEKLNNEASKTAYQGGSGSNAVGTGRSGLSRTLTNYAEGGQADQIEQLIMAYGDEVPSYNVNYLRNVAGLEDGQDLITPKSFWERMSVMSADNPEFTEERMDRLNADYSDYYDRTTNPQYYLPVRNIQLDKAINAPKKYGGEHKYAEGGQAGQIEQLVMAYAQLQAQEQGIDNPEEIRQLAMQVMSQLQNAESQEQQKSILDSMEAALQDAQMPSEPQTQEQLAMMLGGTAKDFQTIAKERIKQYRAGGVTDPDSLDASSTNAYVNGLTKSLESAMRSGHLIGKMRNDMGAISNMFDQLPTADNGFEVTDEELAAHSMSRGAWEGTDDATKMQIADAILADRGEDLSTNPFRKASEGNYDADGNFTGGDDFTANQGSDDINRPLTDEELLEARNLGINDPSFSPGSTRNQILQAKRNAYIDAQMQGAPNPNAPSGTQGYDVNNPYYQGAPGKQQHYYPGWNAEGTGQGDPTTRLLNAMGVDPNSPQAKFRGKGEFRGASIDDMIKALGSTHQATNFRVKDRLFGGKKIKFDTILRDQPAGTPEQTKKNTPSVEELGPNAYWDEEAKEWRNPTPESERNKISGTVHPDAGEPQYIDNPQDKWDRQHNRRIKRQQKREGTYTRNFEDNYTDSELIELYGNDEKGLIKALEKRRKKGIGTYGVQENSKRMAESMSSGDEKARNAAIKAGLGDKPESEYTEADWDAWEAAYEYEYGGAVTWDPVKMRFLPRAAGGASITTQGDFWGDVKEGLGTMGQYMDTLGPAAINFLDAMNQYQSAEQMKPFQSIDAIANVVPTGSGVKGIYADNMRRQMPQDMGEQSMLSSQTDVGTFGQNQRYFSGDIVPQNYAFFGRYGGEKKKAATGMSVGSDHILNDGQIAMLEKLGYKLKLRQ